MGAISRRVIHINRNVIQSNQKKMDGRKEGNLEPPIRIDIETPNGSVISTHYAWDIEIQGPCRMIYKPLQPRKCGAKLWIETQATIMARGDDGPQDII